MPLALRRTRASGHPSTPTLDTAELSEQAEGEVDPHPSISMRHRLNHKFRRLPCTSGLEQTPYTWNTPSSGFLIAAFVLRSSQTPRPPLPFLKTHSRPFLKDSDLWMRSVACPFVPSIGVHLRACCRVLHGTPQYSKESIKSLFHSLLESIL